MGNWYELRLAKLKAIEHLLDARVFGSGLQADLLNHDILQLAKKSGTVFYPTVWLLRNVDDKEHVQTLVKYGLSAVSIDIVHEPQFKWHLGEWRDGEVVRITFCSTVDETITCSVLAKWSLLDMFWKIIDGSVTYE